jgi:malate synthase
MTINLFSEDCLRFLAELNHRFSHEYLHATFPEHKCEFELKDAYTQVKCGPIPEEVKDRTVEITGPASNTKLVINALNSSANVFMADFEDSMSPTWKNVLQGHKNVTEAVNGTLSFQENSKSYNLNEKKAILMVRPRGFHLREAHFFHMNAAVFDFGVYFYNNYKTLMTAGSRPYFYLPKLKNAQEALMWEQIFLFAEAYVKVPIGTIKCTVLTETFNGLLELDLIVARLKRHIIGVNAGRWDYLFSFIKENFRDSGRLLADRDTLHMQHSFMKAYSRRIVEVAKKYKIAPIGGMSALIPIKDDPEKNKAAFENVKLDKLNDVTTGFVGTWVAHPGLIDLARESMQSNGTDVVLLLRTASLKQDITVSSLMNTPQFIGYSNSLLENNIGVCLKYIAAWLNGVGCLQINNLMEDAATAELARMQICSWVFHRVDDLKHVLDVIEEQTSLLEKNYKDSDPWTPKTLEIAHRYMSAQVNRAKTGDFDNFLTESLYRDLFEITNN